MPATVLDAAYWSSWATHEGAARELGRRIGREGDHDEADASARLIADHLEEQGIVVKHGWSPGYTEAASEEYGTTPWAQDETRTTPAGEPHQDFVGDPASE